ncbi:hypothetical protein EBL_c30250 [Shimwellia blattae DSM 4481 = NBRC 105725]|uniref:Uncharacterized protein n=1 Tax=Shimwellia blattae (strain ATCC 29907 / DSM 4481 / JCM 1650 / NBRC 105725 / CDC 9005-74) TaxID=630626 RepID=I2BC41_SHIBC|nr:hypothetical protein EBL_c30250 [Shimwellia blattae DSM 4481 = NBRC 105725]
MGKYSGQPGEIFLLPKPGITANPVFLPAESVSATRIWIAILPVYRCTGFIMERLRRIRVSLWNVTEKHFFVRHPL